MNMVLQAEVGDNCRTRRRHNGSRLDVGFLRTDDADRRVIAQRDARGYLSTFSFDSASERTAVIDANGRIWTISYDNRGDVAYEQDPLGHLTTRSYDPVGNESFRVDGRSWPTRPK